MKNIHFAQKTEVRTVEAGSSTAEAGRFRKINPNKATLPQNEDNGFATNTLIKWIPKATFIQCLILHLNGSKIG